MSQSDACALSVRSLSKNYGPVRACDAVGIDVPRGEFLTLLGPSGSGKTTLLMMIAGFIRPSAGAITLNGRTITHLPPEQRNFGMVFQGYALFPHMTVAQNVGFPLRLRRMDRTAAEKRVGAVLDLVQLGPYRDRFPKELSGGQQQRVALARALSFSPEILLLDEPLGALDRKLRRDVQIELKQLHRQVGTTFIYVTHDQEEALSMSDRVAIFRNGRIMQVGSPAQLYSKPRSRFVADFLGESNFLKGEVVELRNGHVLYRVGGSLLKHGGENKIGNGMLVAIRPEDIRIETSRPEGQDNIVEMTVEDSTYLGSNLSLILRSADLGRIQAVEPSWRASSAPQIGEKVWASWSASKSVEVADE